MTLSDSTTTTEFLSKPLQELRRLIKIIANLKLAIVLLLLIAIFSISGTVIEQGQTLSFYQENYPESPALFGFLTWKVLLAMGLNHVYSTWWFLSLLVLFGASLTACTFTRQIPALKAVKLWKFYDKPRQFNKLALATKLNCGSLDSIIPLLSQRGYKVWQEENSIYARRGIIGKIGPIVVHIGILIVLMGGIWGSLSGFLAQEMILSGNSFQVENIIEAGPFSQSLIPQDWGIKVNRFWIDYTPKGDIDQFYSDLSVVDNDGKELKRETINVNNPLRYKGVTFYQTSWGIGGVLAQINNSPIFQLPMSELPVQQAGQIWGTWIPIKPDMSQGVSLLARDLQGTMLVYDVNGNLASAVRPGMAVDIDGVTLKVYDLIGTTGLQIKADPGIPIVYTGFALLIAGVLMSYMSVSQIWGLKCDGGFYLGGKTNRAQVAFEREIIQVLSEINTQNSSIKV